MRIFHCGFKSFTKHFINNTVVKIQSVILMNSAHLANILLHVSCGTVAILIGFYLLARRKGTADHRRWGRRFGLFTALVVLSAAVGLLWFRFLPLFAVLTILVGYQLLSGWRVIYTKAAGPAAQDALWTALTAVGALLLTPVLFARYQGDPAVLWSTLAALGAILLYDVLRWWFPQHWYARLWRYEHIYKLIASVFAMLSALAGNVLRDWQPWSQLLPSALGISLIAIFFWQQAHQGPRPARRL